MAVLLLVVVAGLFLFGPWCAPAGVDTRTAAARTPSLTLTTSEVRIGEDYFAHASGFAPGEPIELSWEGPTGGLMNSAPADNTGARQHGPVLVRDPPGDYQIIARGLRSGRTAYASLLVLPAR